MGKQKKRGHPSPRIDEFDKPSYAADRIEPAKNPQAPVPNEAELRLEERLGKGTLDKLSALKTAMMSDPAAQSKQGPAAPKRAKASVPRKSAAERLADDPDLSFAELFDPVEDDGASFEELFDSSKLDWRHFKDE